MLEANGDPAYEREREAVRPLADRLTDDVTEDDLVAFVRFASLSRGAAPRHPPIGGYRRPPAAK